MKINNFSSYRFDHTNEKKIIINKDSIL